MASEYRVVRVDISPKSGIFHGTDDEEKEADARLAAAIQAGEEDGWEFCIMAPLGDTIWKYRLVYKKG